MKIPNQNNIADIISSSLNNTSSIVTMVNEFAMLAISTLLKDKNTITEVKSVLLNTSTIISIIASSLTDITYSIFELESVIKSSKLSNTFSSPKKLLNAIKNKKLDDLDYQHGFFDQYIYLLTVCNNIAELSSSIKPKDVKKGKKLIITLINTISSIYVEIYKHYLSSKMFEISGSAVDLLNNVANKLITFLSDSLTKIKEIIEKNQIERKDIKRLVKNLFAVQNALLFEAFLLGIRIKIYGISNILKNLFAFFVLSNVLNIVFTKLEIVIDQMIKISNAGKSFGMAVLYFRFMIRTLFKMFTAYNFKELSLLIIKLNIHNIFIIPLLNNIFTNLIPVVDLLLVLGDNFVKAQFGVNAVKSIFVGKNSVLGYLCSIDPNKLLFLPLANIAAILLANIFTNLVPVVSLLSTAGKEYFNVLLGIRVVNRLFNNSKIFKSTSLIGIFSTIDAKTYKTLLNALPAAILLAIIMSALSVTINTLILAGKNRRKVRRGIKVTIYVLNKLKEILFYINTINIKDVVEATIKLTLISLMITPLTLMMIMLSFGTLSVIGAVFTMIGIIVVIKLYLILLTSINKNKAAMDPKSSIGVAGIVMSIVQLALAFGVISEIEIDFKKIILFTVVSSFTILAYAGISIILSKIPVIGILMLALVCGSMYLSAIIIGKISELNIDYKNIGSFALALLMIIGLVVVITLVSILLPIALLGTALLALEITMITVIAGEIILLSKINIDDIETAKENIHKIFEISTDLVKFFLYQTSGGEKQEGESWMLKTLKYIGGPVAFLAEAIISSLFIATVFITISIMLLLVVELKILENVNINKDKIKGVIKDVLEIIQYLLSVFNQTDNIEKSNEDSSIWGNLITYVFKPFAGILNAIFAMAYVAISVITVTCILFIAGELRLLQEINLDKEKINENIKLVLSIVSDLHSSLTSDPGEKTSEKKGWFRKVLSKIPIVSNAVDLIEAISNFAMVANSMIIVGMLYLITSNLNKIQQIKIDKEKIKINVDSIFETVKTISDQVSSKKLDEDKIEDLEDITDILSDSIVSIGKISVVLGEIASLSIPTEFDNNGKPTKYVKITNQDFINAAENVAKITTTILSGLTDHIIQNGNGKGKSVLEVIEDMSKRSIKKLGMVMESCSNISNIVNLIQQLANMNIATKWDKDGKPIEFTHLGETERQIAQDNIVSIITSILTAICSEQVVNSLDNMSKRSAKNFKTIMESVGFISTIVDTIKNTTEQSEKIKDLQISNIINSYIEAVYGDENGKGGIKVGGNVPKQNGQLRFLIDQQERLSKLNTASLQKNTDNFVKFIDKANSIDVDKIKSIREMFEQMSRFSESVNGNFERLADVLSEKLVDILEKLHITLQDLKDNTFDVQTNNIVSPVKPNYSESIVSAQNPIKNNITEQTKNNNEQERIIAQNQQLTQSINNSLSAIQSLLEEFDRRGILLRS